ncbi:MAG: VWA domain-containing protein [Acidobacteria bacterium]|nr:VWA domain-containing protein [Acidobacteriota bacterium]
MGLLAPLFLLGAVTIAVPIIIHMIQRERKEEVEFPSLMFVRKIPFHSFRRQRIRNWFLLLLRCAALLLLLFAFTRPFFRAAALAAVTEGAREVVVLVDRSWSMGFGDRWADAQAAAVDALDDLAADDQATVILFDSGAESGQRSTTDRASLRSLVSNAEVGSGVTRYGPALKLAEGIFEASDLPRLEAVLISDFQRSGVESASGVRFPPGTVLTPVQVGGDEGDLTNVSVAGVLFQREYFSGRERIQVAARLTNRNAVAVSGLDVTLEVEGREVESLTADLPESGSTTVDFAPVTLGDEPMTGAVRIEGDALPADDVFWFVVSPGQVVRVLLVGNGLAADDSHLFLSRALGIGSEPAFDVRTVTIDALAASDFADREVAILNDTRPPAGAAGAALATFVEEGGGLFVVSGERSAWSGAPDLLPGALGPPADRAGRGGALGFVDYSHPVFEVFSAPRSGDVTTTRFFRYRPIEPADDATVLARFDDGSPALVERRIGSGAVLLWASTIDTFWNDFAKKPVYLPWVHRVVEHLANYSPPTPWFSSGQVLNLAEQDVSLGDGGVGGADYVVMSPSGQRMPVDVGGRAGYIDLAEQGLYEVHDATAPDAFPLSLAVNVDLAESDLTVVDPEELASMVTGRAGGARADGAAAPERVIPAEDLERQQSIWWYLLVAAALLFLSETLVSNRLSRTQLNAE